MSAKRTIRKCGPIKVSQAYLNGSTTDGWWYGNGNSIDVCAQLKSGAVTIVRIRLSEILKRVKVRKEPK